MAASAVRTPARASRSPARDNVADIIKRLGLMREAAAAALQPLNRSIDQKEHAQRLVRIADGKLLDFDRAEAQAVGQSWPPQSPSTKQREQRRVLAEDLSGAERTLRAVEAKAEVARGPAEQAAVKIAEIAAELDVAICAVLAEEGQAALARLVEARRHAIEAEGAVRSIALTMASKQWFRAAEQVSTALYEMPRPEASVDTSPYLRLVEQLALDADATVQP
jgi:hypothetical protein